MGIIVLRAIGGQFGDQSDDRSDRSTPPPESSQPAVNFELTDDVSISDDPDLLTIQSGFGFTLNDGITNEPIWDGELFGLVEVPRRDLVSEPGRCFVLVGTLSPVAPTSGLVSNPADAPSFFLLANNELIDPTAVECNTSDVEAAGYLDQFKATVSAETDFDFQTIFFLPGVETPALDGISVGDPNLGDTLIYRPLFLDLLPQDRRFVGESPVAARELAATGIPTVHTDPLNATDWLVNIAGLVPVATSAGGDGGTCLAIVGTMTPSATGRVPQFPPTVGIFGNGRYQLGGFAECDPATVEVAGYPSILDVDLVIGEEFAFHDVVRIAADTANDLEAIVIGDPTRAGSSLFEATLLDEAPTR